VSDTEDITDQKRDSTVHVFIVMIDSSSCSIQVRVFQPTGGSNKPLPGATAKLVGRAVLTSDNDGFADFGEVPPQEYNIQVLKDGFFPAQPSGSTTEVGINL